MQQQMETQSKLTPICHIKHEIQVLNVVFQDLKQLVEEQSESIDSIEDSIRKTKDETLRAETDLIQTKAEITRSHRFMYGLGLATLCVGAPWVIGVNATIAVASLGLGYVAVKEAD
jgi:t-SNARE complex subunit (syntaxin)